MFQNRFLSDLELAHICSAKHGDFALPFTGERVVPGAVEGQLWSEHASRYRFASLFTDGRRVLDAGCGAGYGTEMLARSAKYTIGCDVSVEALTYARSRFRSAAYLTASVASLPFGPASFDLVVSFEVIEHLEHWSSLLTEASRVLSPGGIFLVSTPNTAYYAESRGPSGPNPYHMHEFTMPEFEEALGQFFPCVQILAQNQQEAITFAGNWTAEQASAFLPPCSDPSDAHFFLAVCSREPVGIPFFADVASTHNLLREREKHLWGVMGELDDLRQQHLMLTETYQNTLSELSRLKAQFHACLERETRLSNELALTQENLERLQMEHVVARGSTWIKLGRVLGLGPWSARRPHASQTRGEKNGAALQP